MEYKLHKRQLVKGQLVAATHNAGKFRELCELFAPLGFTIVSAAACGLPEPDETGFTFAENALIKARAAMRVAGLPAIADDSGLMVTALGGMPGVDTAGWAGQPRDFHRAMTRVERELRGLGATDRSASFVCCLAVVWPDGKEQTFQGTVCGTLVWPPRGTMGFGFDPVFVPQGSDKTFAELEPGVKDAMSHRGQAFAKLKAALL